MLHLYDPMIEPDINAGGLEAAAAMPITFGVPESITVYGSNVPPAPSTEADPVVREIRLSAFVSIMGSIKTLADRVTALEVAVEALAARLQELSVSR